MADSVMLALAVTPVGALIRNSEPATTAL